MSEEGFILSAPAITDRFHEYRQRRIPRQAWQTDVPLDQALVLAGGESTNPRDYDPATTYSSGDKLVFSGLVSFDPQLNLTPDLAESWDVSADGTVYTFHLRQNAKFHDGRAVTAQDVIYSWERAASPALASDTALTYLGDIVGIREMNAGTGRSHQRIDRASMTIPCR